MRRPQSKPDQRRHRKPGRRAVAVVGKNGERAISLRVIAVFLFAILAVIIIAPTAARYTSQQEQLRQVRAEYSEMQERSAQLEAELALWQNDDFVREQARSRLGYVVPGETLYVTRNQEEGSAQQQLAERVEQSNRTRRANTPWYMTMWDSIRISGYSSDGTLDNPNDTPVFRPGSQTPAPAETPATEATDPAAESTGEPAAEPAAPQG